MQVTMSIEKSDVKDTIEKYKKFEYPIKYFFNKNLIKNNQIYEKVKT